MDWWAYYQVEPWGDQRSDARSIHHVNLIAGLFGDEFRSQVAVPKFIADIYSDAPMSDELRKNLESIRGNSSNHIHRSAGQHGSTP